jgi:hypothetical protein
VSCSFWAAPVTHTRTHTNNSAQVPNPNQRQSCDEITEERTKNNLYEGKQGKNLLEEEEI